MKITPSTRHNNLFHKLRPIFNEARSKGQLVDFNWLWLKVRRIYRDEGKEEVVKKHVVVTFIRRNRLKYRRIQRNKKQSKEAFREELVKWHGTLRERLIRTGNGNNNYDKKWGYFKPSQRLNVDQWPLPFSYECRKTYEDPEKYKKKSGLVTKTQILVKGFAH